MKSNNKRKIIRILTLVLREISQSFPYAFVFYIGTLFMNLFFGVFEGFLNWQFAGKAVLVMGIVSIFCFRKENLKNLLERKREWLKFFFTFLKSIFKEFGFNIYIKIFAIIIFTALIEKFLDSFERLLIFVGLILVIFFGKAKNLVVFFALSALIFNFGLILDENILAKQFLTYTYYILIFTIIMLVAPSFRKEKEVLMAKKG